MIRDDIRNSCISHNIKIARVNCFRDSCEGSRTFSLNMASAFITESVILTRRSSVIKLTCYCCRPLKRIPIESVSSFAHQISEWRGAQWLHWIFTLTFSLKNIPATIDFTSYISSLTGNANCQFYFVIKGL